MGRKLKEGIPLTELDASFVQITNRRGSDASYKDVATLAEADGVRFLCPKCCEDAGPKMIGVHQVLCWFEGKVPVSVSPGPGRWKPKGTGIEDLSFVAGKKSRSVKLLSGCKWHGFITDGKAT